MSQAQPTIEKIHSLRKKQETALKSLTLIGYLEGTSFLLLLFIAMPLKYMLDIPEGVKYIGMAHGIFVYYLYHNTYRLSYQNENASLGNTCGRTRLTLTFWPVYIRSFTKKEFTGKCK